MRKINTKTATWHEVGLNCSNRAMYSIRDDIYNMAMSIDEEMYDTSIGSYSDYEGDLEKIVLYYDKENENHIKLWKMICEKYDIVFIENLENEIHLHIFS